MDQNDAAPIRIFRPGRFLSMEGVEVNFSTADLQAIADAYDPARDPAPLVVGHPRTDDPAFGWVAGLSVEGGALVATPEKIEPSFAEMVRAGRYRKVSARFFPPDAASNPKPGSYYLKHVGFLGAAAPAVSGLGTVQFADDDDGFTLIISTNQETEMPPKEDKELSFAEREAELARREAEADARDEATRKAAAKARHDANVSFAESLVQAGKLKPAGKALAVGVLDALDSDKTVSFADAGEMTPAEGFRKLMGSAEPMISFTETVPSEQRKEAGAVSFAAPDGYEVDPAQADLHARAKTIQTENPKLGWMDCVRRAQAA